MTFSNTFGGGEGARETPGQPCEVVKNVPDLYIFSVF